VLACSLSASGKKTSREIKRRRNPTGKKKDDTSKKKRTPSFGWKAIILEQGQEKKQYHHSMHYIHFLQHNKAIKP
jgi:hypothetical protein